MSKKNEPIWVSGPVRPAFWTYVENRRAYFHWLGRQLRIRKPEDWYEVRSAAIIRLGGAAFFKYYGRNIFNVVSELMPEHQWHEWCFRRVPPGFWDDRNNRCRYLDWLGEKLDFQEPEDWYQLSYGDVERNRGSALLQKFDGSVVALVCDCMPQYEWKEWFFSVAGESFWGDPKNRRRYLDWLGEELGFNKIEDWYRLTSNDLNQYRGYGLCRMFNSSPYAVVKAHFPDYEWWEWRFRQVGTGFWQDPKNCRRYLDWLGKQLGFKRFEDWYAIDSRKIKSNYGGGFLSRFDGRPTAAVMSCMPEYEWREWMFSEVPTGFWQDPNNRRRYLEWLGKKLGFKKHEDWYRLGSDDLRANYGYGLLKLFGYSPSAAVVGSMPEHQWWEWKFNNVPLYFWSEPRNRRRYLDWLGRELGFKKLDDWYQVTVRDFYRHHGGRMAVLLGSSPSAILKDYRPDYDWKEWLFGRVPRGFWKARVNRRRYLDWLGDQLGFTHPDSWRRLRRFHIERNHGRGLLKLYGRSLERILKDYFAAKGYLPWKEL